jgi:hypothetical protein
MSIEENRQLPAPTAASEGRGVFGAGIFQLLVTNDSDIIGLVAYALYKQSKLDWMRQFESERSRWPDDAELSSFIIGEGTSRRLATYRHLAETALEAWREKRDAEEIASGRMSFSYGKMFNWIVVALALALLAMFVTARLVFGHK